MTKKLGIPMFTKPVAGTQAHNHPEGNAFYKNLVEIVTPEYDAISANGTGLVLGATNELPIPVGYDLATNIGIGIGSPTIIDGTGSSDFVTDGRYYIGNGDSSSDIQYYIPFNCTATEVDGLYYLSFDYVVNSGNVTISRIYGGGNVYPDDVLTGSGTYTVEVETPSSRTSIYIYIDNTTAFDINITTPTIQQITTTGYLTYETDDGVVQIGNAVDGGSSEELVVNGDFEDGDTGWSVGTGWTITGGIARHEGDFGRIEQVLGEVGRTYLIKFDLVHESGGNFQIGFSSETVDFNTTGSHETVIVSNGTKFEISAGSAIGSVDNVSVKEILPNSTTYTLVDDTYRWAYVNENPFSEADLTAIAEEPNKIVEFAFDIPDLDNIQGTSDKFYGFRENSGAWCVDALQTFGTELVTNGTFDTDLSGWTIVGTQTVEWIDGRAHLLTDGGILEFNDNGVISFGRLVVTTFDLEILSGSWEVFSPFSSVVYTESGSYSNISTGRSDSFKIKRYAGIAGECYIDNVSVREATAEEISNYTDAIRTATANSQTSIQWTCAELDSAGVPTAYNSTPNTAIMHSDTSISTGFKPNIGQYSIEETVTGNLAVLDVNGDPTGSFTQRTEQRLLTHTDAHLGDEMIGEIISNGGNTVVDNLDGTFTLTVIDNAGGCYSLLESVTGKTYLAEMNIISSTDTSGFALFDVLPQVVASTTVSSSNTVTVTSGESTAVYFSSLDIGAVITFNWSFKEVSTQNKYYINGLEQAVTPVLPDPAVTINLNDTAIIGYNDIIESREAPFNVHSEIIIP